MWEKKMLQDKLEADLKRFIDIPDNRTESGKILLTTIVQAIGELYRMMIHVNPLEIKATVKPIVEPELLLPNLTLILPELPDEEFIPIPDFVENYRLLVDGKRKIMATTGSVAAALREDDELVKYAGDRGPNGNRWFVKPLRFIHYLSRSKVNPKLRARCKEWLKQQENNLS
jgi:hypothetical protein